MKPKVVVTIAIILGLITSILVYSFLGTPQHKEKEEVKVVSVVVAKENIQPRQEITDDLLEIKNIPKERAHFQSITELKKVSGSYASDKIIAGEQILKSRLYDQQETNSMMAFNLGIKERAVTVAVDEVVGVAGFLMPGDYVDVVGVFSGLEEQTVVKTVLQNVKVLAIAQDMTTNKNIDPQVKKSVTLAVGLPGAEKLILADREGKIRLALRSPKNDVKEGSTGLSLEQLIEKKAKKEASKNESYNTAKKTTDQQKKSTVKKEPVKKEDISKKVEVIRGLNKNYEDVLINPKEAN